MDAKTSSPVSVFDEVLRAFETGGFTFNDVLVQLKRLLAEGASPAELLESLRRRELIEPLPKNAHAEVVGLLDDAKERDDERARAAALGADAQSADAGLPVSSAATPTPTSAAPPATTAATASSSASHGTAEPSRVQELERALTERTAAAEAARSRADEALRELARYQHEARALRESLAARDADIVQVRRSLTERDADFTALQREHARIVPALEGRAKTGTQLETDLQAARARSNALDAELAVAKAALVAEQSKSREIGRASSAKAAASDAARAGGEEEALRESARRHAELRALHDSLAARDATLVQVRHSLAERDDQIAERDAQIAERDAEFAALQAEHAKLVPALAAQAKTGSQLQADLQAARVRAEAVTLRSQAGQETVALLNAQLKRDESDLNAVRAELDAARVQSSSYLESLRTRDWQHGFAQNTVRELHARVGAGDDARAALQAERDRLQSLLTSSQAEAAGLRAEVTGLQAQMSSLQAPVSSSQADVAGLRAHAQVEDSPAPLGVRDALSKGARAGADADADASDAAEWQTAPFEEVGSPQLVRSSRWAADAEMRTPTIPEPGPEVPAVRERVTERWTAAPDGERTPIGEFEAKLPAPRRGATWTREAVAIAKGLGALVLVVAAVVWFFGHHAQLPPPATAAVSAAVPKAGTVIRDCAACPTMVVLPAGRFKQGSALADSGSSSFERPLHWVAIGHPFAMSTNDVTVAEFSQFAAAGGRDMEGCDTYDGKWKHQPKSSWKEPGFPQTGMHPVTCVSWDDAEGYAAWLSTKTGHRYRLPSASEWEYAARAGAQSAQPWSGDGPGACANANVADESAALRFPGWSVFACNDGYVYTAPVGSFKRNAFGLNDMLGNVFQWTLDCWHADYSGAPVDGSARMDGDCAEHELRGGSWFSTPAYVRANYRNHFAANYRTSSAGIRLVREMEK